MLHEFMYYVFDSLLIPLIKTNFYVTESSTHRYEVFYFRHDVWRHIAEPAFSQLKKSMFQEIGPVEASASLDARRLGFSHIRLLPKGDKVRPIMNLRRRQMRRNGSRILGPSINSILGPVHTVLRYEKVIDFPTRNEHASLQIQTDYSQDNHAERLGSTLFSVSDMYERLKTFKESLDMGGKPRNLYFAKLDVKSAFDTIPQEAVVKLMQSIPSEAEYAVTKHAEVYPGERTLLQPNKTATRTIRRWHSTALKKSDDNSFMARLTHSLANEKKHTVFVDGVALKHHNADALLALLADHVQRNLVKVGKKYYRQKQGIPQGSVISSFLCNYFYADLEKQHLGFLIGPDTLLMRLIDDFLLISLEKAKATQFVQTMHRGVPEYGVSISPEKTLVNFDMQVDGVSVSKIQPGKGFPYCGTVINDRTLDITKDRDRVISKGLYLTQHLATTSLT